MRSPLNRRLLLLSVASLLPGSLVPGKALAQSPVATPQLPEGALGDQIAWVMQIVNEQPGALTEADITAHVAPSVLAQLPASALSTSISQLAGQYGPFTIVPDSLVTTRDMPASSATFIVNGKDGARFQVSIAIDPGSGLIAALNFAVAPPVATPQASPAAALPATVDDVDVRFASGADTLYGSLMTPKGAASGAAALIISGSGPTDRNGNSGGLTVMNTNLNLATTLAGDGIASLRYDKLGSGKTGLGTHVNGQGIDYTLFLNEAIAAETFLAAQQGVDPSKLVLVGHSEGGLFALTLARELIEQGTTPAAIILVAPLGVRYLDVITEQVTAQYTAAVAAKLVTQAQADSTLTHLAAIVDQLRTSGTLPQIEDPALRQIFSPSSATFLAETDRIDPATVAAALPRTLPVLVLHGGKDQQISASDVAHLMSGFAKAGNTAATLVEIPDANHLMKVVTGIPNAAVDYANPDLPFSPDAVQAIDTFLAKEHLTA